MITLLGCLYLTSCYTTFRAPRQNGLNDERNVDDSAIREDAIDRYLTPSLPEARWHDYDWIYYYQSAWWLDESQGIWGTEAASHPDPEEYRRRFPQGQYPDGGSVAAPAPTFSAPGLSKPRE
ncbi:hypothetical protein JXO59_02240, partial [candidate division KSB1 bacterium]|nr:hypothetical protein [candidate division KSB1 bacterium]